ncbi:MAG: O-antigen/teichoic acid export membrane protein [Candidatus Latescibacterota bacterium]|jgi:O-antigen/teichoic acid export membrane protein
MRDSLAAGLVGEQSLATRAVRGAFWTGGGIAAQLVVTLIFFKVLALKDMGYFTWAQRVVLFLPLFGALGLNDALVKFQEATEVQFSTSFWACLLCGGLLYGGLVFYAETLGHWVSVWATGVDASAFIRVLKPMALIVPVASVSGVIRARLARDLRFRSIAVSEISSVFFAAVIGLGLLAFGYGIESAVWNFVLREFVLLGSLWISARWMPRLVFEWTSLRQLLGFGLNVTGANLVNYVNNNLDKVYFVFILLGPVSNALYTFAYQYTMTPLTRAGQILTRVCFPAFAKVQDDDAALGRAYLRTVGMIALGAWPILAGAFVFAPEFLWVVKGNEMLSVINVLRLLIVAGMLKAVGTVVGSVFFAKGKANWSFRWTVINLIVFVPALSYGVEYGLDGIAFAISILAFLAMIVTQFLVNKLIAISWADYVDVLVRPALITCLLGVLLWVLKPALSTDPLFALMGGCVIGGCFYVLGIRLLAWSLVMRFWHDFRGQS